MRHPFRWNSLPSATDAWCQVCQHATRCTTLGMLRNPNPKGWNMVHSLSPLSPLSPLRDVDRCWKLLRPLDIETSGWNTSFWRWKIDESIGMGIFNDIQWCLHIFLPLKWVFSWVSSIPGSNVTPPASLLSAPVGIGIQPEEFNPRRRSRTFVEPGHLETKWMKLDKIQDKIQQSVNHSES